MTDAITTVDWFRRVGRTAGLAVGLGVLGSTSPAAAGMGMFADCIADSGAVFYDAHWCGNCAQQRSLFRGYANRLNIVECYAPDDSNNLRRSCKDAKVRSFPTWVFGDGSRRSGLLSLDDLAAETGCAKP